MMMGGQKVPSVPTSFEEHRARVIQSQREVCESKRLKGWIAIYKDGVATWWSYIRPPVDCDEIEAVIRVDYEYVPGDGL